MTHEMETKVINIIQSIDNAMLDYIADNDIENLNKISMSQWNALLIYINNTCFGNGILKNKNSNIKMAYNVYDYELLEYICDYYIYLCYKHDKEVSLSGFSKLTGIAWVTLNTIGKGEILSSKDSDIRKKLLAENEQSLSNKLFDGKGNPVGVIAILNHWHNWQTAAAAKGEQKPALKADQLPDLSLMDGQKQEKPGLLDNMHKEE